MSGNVRVKCCLVSSDVWLIVKQSMKDCSIENIIMIITIYVFIFSLFIITSLSEGNKKKVSLGE
jgi:hypothetical protein